MLIYTFRLSFVQKDSSAKSKKRVGKNQHTIVLTELNTIHSFIYRRTTRLDATYVTMKSSKRYVALSEVVLARWRIL